MARPVDITRQERVLESEQRKLERLDKMREQVAQQVEIEQKRLEEIRQEASDFAQGMVIQPSLSDNAPAGFKSQFDQFNTNATVDKLTSTSQSIIPASSDLLKPVKDDLPSYQQSDRDQHFSSLYENPGKQVYVSGIYISSPHGTHKLNTLKEYEYEVSQRALPLSVGDVVRVPVHMTGHKDGRMKTTGHLQYQVTDIYTKNKFTPYHDVIED